jgi:hypothetical protein
MEKCPVKPLIPLWLILMGIGGIICSSIRTIGLIINKYTFFYFFYSKLSKFRFSRNVFDGFVRL